MEHRAKHNQINLAWSDVPEIIEQSRILVRQDIHMATACFHCDSYTLHDAANLNSALSKYARVARVHYFCTIALRTPYTRMSVAYGAFMRSLD